ncbi:MAG: hypothetical protein ACLQPD_19045 [Desulfomonilaceae bacterium]
MLSNSVSTTADQTRSTDRVGKSRLFAVAAALARKGRYAEASKLLQRALIAGECMEPEALDLQARIYAQQGLYLHAESCWDRAKRLDGSNPAYDKALSRLRRSRLSAGRYLELISILAGTAVLGLVVWQIAFVNPRLSTGLNANRVSITKVHEDIARLEDASKARDREYAMNIASLGSRLGDLDSRLSSRMNSLPTAAETKGNRDEIIASLDERTTELQKALVQEVVSLRRAVFRLRQQLAE